MGGLSGFGAAALVRGAAGGLKDIKDQDYQDQMRKIALERAPIGLQLDQQHLKEGEQRMTLNQSIEQRAEAAAGRVQEQYTYGKTQRGVSEQHAQMENTELGARTNALNSETQWNSWMHKTQQQQMEFQMGFDKAMRGFVMTNGANYQPLQDVYNHLYPDGNKVAMSRNADGTFDIHTTMSDGKQVDQKSIPYSNVGIMAMGMRDPNAYWQHAIGAQVKQADNTFQLDKIAKKGGYDMQVAQIRSGNMGALRIDKEFMSQANRDWGNTGANGMVSFDAPAKSSAANLQAWTASELQKTIPGAQGTLMAQQRAHAIVQQAFTKAQQDAQVGGGSSDEIAARQNALLDSYVKQGLSSDVLNIQKTYGATAPTAGQPGETTGTQEQFRAAFKQANPTATDTDADAYYTQHHAGKAQQKAPESAAPSAGSSLQESKPSESAASSPLPPQHFLATPPPPTFDHTPGGQHARTAYGLTADKYADQINDEVLKLGYARGDNPVAMMTALQSTNLTPQARQAIQKAMAKMPNATSGMTQTPVAPTMPAFTAPGAPATPAAGLQPGPADYGAGYDDTTDNTGSADTTGATDSTNSTE